MEVCASGKAWALFKRKQIYVLISALYPQLGILGQVAWPLWSSISSSLKALLVVRNTSYKVVKKNHSLVGIITNNFDILHDKWPSYFCWMSPGLQLSHFFILAQTALCMTEFSLEFNCPHLFLLLLPLDSILCDSFLFNSPPTPHSPQILVLAEYTVSLVIFRITGPLCPYHNCCFFWTYSSLLILSIGLLPEQTPELHHHVPCFGSFF